MSEYILKYSINFKNQEQCHSTHQTLSHLCEDNYAFLRSSFSSMKSEHLLSNAIEGLIVFLTCKRSDNTLIGSFYTSDKELDQQIFQDFIHEQSTAEEKEQKNITIQLHTANA